MLFIVIREIEAKRPHVAAFILISEAKQYYNDAVHVCDSGPDDDPEDDPTIVTNCWLYEVATLDPELAKGMALDGTARLLASYEGDGYLR